MRRQHLSAVAWVTVAALASWCAAAESISTQSLLDDMTNLAKMAEFHGIPWLNLNNLAAALRQEISVGDTLEVNLVKAGKEEGQAVGFLDDGSMVVVTEGRSQIGRRVSAEVVSVLPSAGGKLVFARLLGEAV
jgi:uncharacterized protein YacL